jgi:phosphoglycolate phosphatase
MHVDHIIFDLDGTLVDSFPDIYQAFRVSALELDLLVPLEATVKKNMHLRLDQMVMEMFPGSDREKVIRRFREHYDGSGYPNTFPYPGVGRTIEALRARGCHMFVATNKRKRATEAIIARIGLEDAFELVISSDIRDPPLNKTEIVHRIMTEKGLEASHTVLVGDTQGDWKAATENGIHFILAEYGYGNICPDKIEGGTIGRISSFLELVDFFTP